MIIPLVGDGSGQEPKEWALIELQGKFEFSGEEQEQMNKEIGMLRMSATDANQVQLTIGYHLLVGKRVILKKPFAILESIDVPADSQREGVCKQYQVVGVIRSKILFKTRPTAMISKPAVRR